MKKSELFKIIKETLEEEKPPGLWANIRAKRKKVGKKGMAKKGSKAYKSAKKAGNRINKEKNEELKNPKLADLDKDGKLSSYEKTRGSAIEKNLKEMCGPIREYLNEIEAEDETEFTVSLKHLLDKHVTTGGEMKEHDIEFTKDDMATLHNTGKLEKGGNTYEYDVEDKQDVKEFVRFMRENYSNTLEEAEYKGRKVKLGKPMRGDVKKFKVYVKNPKGNVVKVNFGHGGTSAKKRGEKTMSIRKNNPKARKAFRARHKCDSPGPRHKARYWSCRKW